MRRIIITIIALVSLISAKAQNTTKGSFSNINKGGSFCVKIDYSDALLQKDSEEGYAKTEEQWEASGKNEVLDYFLSGLNDEGEGFSYIKAEKADYTLVFHVKELYVSKKVFQKCLSKGYVTIIGPDTDILIENFEDEKRFYGTTIFLFKKGMQDMGKIVASYINNRVK